MCGIFGFVQPGHTGARAINSTRIIQQLFLLSESRGKEASGFASAQNDRIYLCKIPQPSHVMVASRDFKDMFGPARFRENSAIAMLGHTRLVTHGYEHDNRNNQPVVRDQVVAVHNGIIVNVQDLWNKSQNLQKTTNLDSEIIPAIIGTSLSAGNTVLTSLRTLYASIFGVANIALLFSKWKNLALATNNGSLYYISDPSFFMFASESIILKTILDKCGHKPYITQKSILQLKPNTCGALNTETMAWSIDSLAAGYGEEFPYLGHADPACEIFEPCQYTGPVTVINRSLEHGFPETPERLIRTWEERRQRIQALRRCSKCLLPETHPFISFSNDGICNYCESHCSLPVKGLEAFEKIVEAVCLKTGHRRCLVPFSGGRDSSYVLHLVKTRLRLEPLAFSYDWGMITDLARRNQSRLCGKLGVEHILISADIRKKRENIRKNVLAWLNKPDLGTVPLFMAGDKQYFYHANKLMETYGLTLSVFGENLLETTNFKSGFCGIRPNFIKQNTYGLQMGCKIRMVAYYLKKMIGNTSFFNASLFDSASAFASYYLIRHNNVNLYEYIPWDEKEIISVLRSAYDWEVDPETALTWRIGDGTAAFYNYIYYMIAGFTENDAFRSNQIRQGLLTRENGLKLIEAENEPRWEALKRYCATIGVSFNETVGRINSVSPLFTQEAWRPDCSSL